METYTNKPVTIKAVQWNGNNTDEIIEWGKRKIEFSSGRPATIHSLSCQCEGRGIIPSDGLRSSAITCPETLPTGAIPSSLLVLTPVGKMTAEVEDWVIKSQEGFYVCKKAAFAKTYEPVKKPHVSSTEDEVRSFGTVEEVRMMLAEAGHPDVPVRTDPDGWAIPLGDEPRQAPEGVHWRITQLITQRYNDPDGSWCWACYQAGYDADECEADFPMAQDCGRHRG